MEDTLTRKYGDDQHVYEDLNFMIHQNNATKNSNEHQLNSWNRYY